jgi:hypothetical protein
MDKCDHPNQNCIAGPTDTKYPKFTTAETANTKTLQVATTTQPHFKTTWVATRKENPSDSIRRRLAQKIYNHPSYPLSIKLRRSSTNTQPSTTRHPHRPIEWRKRQLLRHQHQMHQRKTCHYTNPSRHRGQTKNRIHPHRRTPFPPTPTHSAPSPHLQRTRTPSINLSWPHVQPRLAHQPG